jgi:hypothetical protein
MARRVRTAQVDLALSDEAALQWLDRVRRYLGVPTSDSPLHARRSLGTAEEVGALMTAAAPPAELVTVARDLLHESGFAWAAGEADQLLNGGVR